VGVVIIRFWLCLIVLGFKSHRTGRDWFKGFGTPLWDEINAGFYEGGFLLPEIKREPSGSLCIPLIT